MKTQQTPLQRLKHHVTGAIKRGEKTPIVEQRNPVREANAILAKHIYGEGSPEHKMMLEAAAPVQAQPRKPDTATHSPLPWLSHEGRIWHWNGKPIPVAATDKRDASFLEVANNGKANAEFIVRAVNNAQRLADALENIIERTKVKGRGQHWLLNDIQKLSREALAEWSKAQ